MSAKIIPLPGSTSLPERILQALQLELVPTRAPAIFDPLFQCQRCEWVGFYPPTHFVPQEACEFPHCPACGSFNVILEGASRATQIESP